MVGSDVPPGVVWGGGGGPGSSAAPRASGTHSPAPAGPGPRLTGALPSPGQGLTLCVSNSSTKPRGDPE